MDEIDSPEPVAAPERLPEAEVLDHGRGHSQAHEPEPGDRRNDRGGSKEGHEEVDRDGDGKPA